MSQMGISEERSLSLHKCSNPEIKKDEKLLLSCEFCNFKKERNGGESEIDSLRSPFGNLRKLRFL